MVELDLLESLALFRNLPAELLEPIRAAAEQRRVAAGETVFFHGAQPDFLYVIESGAVDVSVPTQNGEIVVASFEAGSFFGELAVFDRQPRSATARALLDSSLLCIPLEAVSGLIDSSRAAARQFITAIAHRLRSADELLSRLQIQNVNDIADEKMTAGERVADRVARFGGSWTFIIVFTGFLLLWIAANTIALLRNPPDPFPYVFLNLILSCVAALQAPVIMMSQNRQAAKDRIQADLEFQINVKAEVAVQQLHRKLDDLRGALLQQAQARQRP
jgi:uncharacterized membrane protein